MTADTGGAPQANEKRVDLVFEGGGVKGIALVGALSVLEERGYQIQNRAGTSAGAVVATMSAAGFTALQIRDITTSESFSSYMDPTWLEKVPLIRDIHMLPWKLDSPTAAQLISVVFEEGMYKGDVFLAHVREHLGAQNVQTFGQLRNPNADPNGDERYRYKVQVIVSDLTGQSLLVLPKDSQQMLGVPPDDLDVALAVRMSMSIPLFFKPVKFQAPTDNKAHTMVDGGLLSNFPVWFFDSQGTPEWPTFGLKLVSADPKQSLASDLPPTPVTDFISYLESLISTMWHAHDRLYLAQDQFVRTITIPATGVDSTNFNLTAQDEQNLFDAGRAAAETFLQDWDDAGGFPAYVAAYRQQPLAPRRERALAPMRAMRNGKMKSP
jgi:NTE family protein